MRRGHSQEAKASSRTPSLVKSGHGHAGSQPQRNLKPHPVMSQIKINYDPTEPLTPDELGLLDAHAA